MAFPFPTFTSPSRLVHVIPGAKPCPVLVSVLENLGFRELAAAELYAAGVRWAETLDDKQVLLRHGLDELEHFERVAATYEELTDESLLSKVQDRVRAVPLPGSWVETAVIGLLFDRASTFQLRAYETSHDPIVANLARRLLLEEHDHLATGTAAVVELCRNRPWVLPEAQAHYERWLRLSLSTFDERVPRSDRCSKAPHVDTMRTLEAMTRYVTSLGAALEASGLRMPRYSSPPPRSLR